MKTTLFILLGGSVMQVSCSQHIAAEKVPSVVQNSVQTAFGTVANIEWEKKKQFFEAEFDRDSVSYTAFIDATGKVLAHKSEIDLAQLPASVIATVEKDHPGYTIDEAEKLEQQGVVYFEVELEAKGKKDKNLLFTADGKPAPANAYVN